MMLDRVRPVIVLVVGQTPPPYHGQAMMIRYLLNYEGDEVQWNHVRMAFSDSMSEVGRFQMQKIVHLLWVILQIYWTKIRSGSTVLYYPPASPNRIPFYRDLVLLISTRWLFKTTVFHFHANGISQMLQGARSWEKWLAKIAYGRPNAAICLSPETTEDAKFMQCRAHCIIPNGIPDEFESSPFGHRTSETDILRLLYLGTVNETKGILDLLDACRQLKRMGRAFHLTVVGSYQPTEFELEIRSRLTQFEIESNVTLSGQLTGQAKHAAYQQADVFCFPSYYESEGFPCVLLEAMSFGLPVLSTRWRGIPSIVDEGVTGLLVSPRDVDAMINALELLSSRPDVRRAFGKAGRDKFLRCFTVEKFQRSVVDAIKQAVVGTCSVGTESPMANRAGETRS